MEKRPTLTPFNRGGATFGFTQGPLFLWNKNRILKNCKYKSEIEALIKYSNNKGLTKHEKILLGSQESVLDWQIFPLLFLLNPFLTTNNSTDIHINIRIH